MNINGYSECINEVIIIPMSDDVRKKVSREVRDLIWQRVRTPVHNQTGRGIYAQVHNQINEELK